MGFRVSFGVNLATLCLLFLITSVSIHVLSIDILQSIERINDMSKIGNWSFTIFLVIFSYFFIKMTIRVSMYLGYRIGKYGKAIKLSPLEECEFDEFWMNNTYTFLIWRPKTEKEKETYMNNLRKKSKGLMAIVNYFRSLGELSAFKQFLIIVGFLAVVFIIFNH